MNKVAVSIVVIFCLVCCGEKKQEAAQTHPDSVVNSVGENDIQPEDSSLEIKIFPLDSVLEINYRKYKNDKGEYGFEGVNIIDRQTKHWLFDSEGPQIESYSDIEEVSDAHFVVSVYYNIVTSQDTIPRKLRIAKYDLRLNQTDKTYSFSKDSLFWPTSAFSPNDIANTIGDYQKLIDKEFLSDSTNADQPPIWNMFKVQERLLSSFISGCDSCEIYSNRLFKKFDHALFASDSDYAGEIGSVFKILNTSRTK